MNFKSGGKVTQQLRKQKNLTQEQLAEQVALSSNTISRIERGLLMPSVATLCDLCNALETSADNILAAYIHADSAIRWSPLAEQLQALSPKKQEQVERMLACLLEIL